MSDSFTETTSRSWFSRLKSALSGVVVGLLLVVISGIGLFWNEGRSVTTARALAEGAGLVRTIDPAAPPADATGMLVHFSGPLTPEGRPVDPLFAGIAAPEGTLELVRRVEMYQWEETSKSETRTKLGGGEETVTTYSYQRKWSTSPIDSSAFKQPTGHTNPRMPVQGDSFTVASAKVGAIRLAGEDLGGIGQTAALPANRTMAAAISGAFGSDRIVTPEGEAISVRAQNSATTIGDLRISYEFRDADSASAFGRLEGLQLAAYTTSNGRSLLMVQAGEASAQEMFDSAISSNSILTWVIRVVGFIAMLIGFNLMMSVIGVLGDVIPFIGTIMRFASGLVAFAITSVLATLVIAFAWFWYRPLLAAAILAVGLTIAFVALRLGKAKATSAAQASPAGPA